MRAGTINGGVVARVVIDVPAKITRFPPCISISQHPPTVLIPWTRRTKTSKAYYELFIFVCITVLCPKRIYIAFSHLALRRKVSIRTASDARKIFKLPTHFAGWILYDNI